MNDFSKREFLQDFLQEAGEHIQQVHQNLLELESAGSSTPEQLSRRLTLVDELFRSFHTLKSLTGMVGLQPGSRLAHGLETALDGIRKDRIPVTSDTIDILLKASTTLGKIIETVRDPALDTPEIYPDVSALEQLESQSPTEQVAPSLAARPAKEILSGYPEVAASMNEADWLRLQAALDKYPYLSLAIFTPSEEKANSGITIASLREKFAAAGELIKALPLVSGQTVRFALLGASQTALDPSNFPELEWFILSPSGKTSSQPAAQAAPQQAARPAGSTLRVELSRVDESMFLASKLVVTHFRLSELVNTLDGVPAEFRFQLHQELKRMDRELRDLRQAILRIRLVPLAEAFNPMPLAVRDLARSLKKDVRLVTRGEDTTLDKAIIERLVDPLMHLVRNAVVHGIESPRERAKAGKPAVGTITLIGEQQGEHVLVTVMDDGRGIDQKKVMDRAVKMGWIQPGEEIDCDQMLEMISRRGFTTQSKTTLGAGRGVGMDIVQQAVSSMGGLVSLETTAGHGTAFKLSLPLTLSVIKVVLVTSGGQWYAIPQNSIREMVEIDPGQITRVEGGELYPLRGTSLALLRLNELFHFPEKPEADGNSKYAVILEAGSGRTAILIDHLKGLRETVALTLHDPLVARPGVVGATELGDGSLALILDVAELIKAK